MSSVLLPTLLLVVSAARSVWGCWRWARWWGRAKQRREGDALRERNGSDT